MLKYKLITTGMLPTNTYILYDDATNDCVVIDPAFDGGKVLSILKDKKFNLKGILLTHGHFDHCGGVKTLLEYKNVDVYGNSLDAELAANASKNQWRARAQDCTITKFVDNEKDFSIGNFKFSVMNTPGHTEGGVCYFIDDLMFSGDTLFCDSVGRTDLQGGDSAKLAESLKKIANIKKNYTVLAGHMETTDLDTQKRTNPYLKAEAIDFD